MNFPSQQGGYSGYPRQQDYRNANNNLNGNLLANATGNSNGGGIRMNNFNGQNNGQQMQQQQQQQQQQYPNYMNSGQYDQTSQQQYYVQQPNQMNYQSQRPMIQMGNRMYPPQNQNRYYSQDGYQLLDRNQSSQFQNRYLEIEDVQQQQQQDRNPMMNTGNYQNRYKDSSSIPHQIDRVPNVMNSSFRYPDQEGFGYANNSSLQRFNNKDGVIQNERISSNTNNISQFIELEDDDEDEQESQKMSKQGIQQTGNHYGQTNKLKNNNDYDTDENNCSNNNQDDSIEEEFNKFKSLNYSQNLQSSIQQVRPAQFNNQPIQNNNPISYSQNQQQRTTIQIQNNGNNSSLSNEKKQNIQQQNNFLLNNNYRSSGNSQSQQVNSQQSVNNNIKKPSPIQDQIEEDCTVIDQKQKKQIILDTESSTDGEEFTTLCELTKLVTEKDKERFSDDLRYEYLKKEVKEYEGEGKRIKYYRNKEKYLKKIGSNDYYKICSYEDERIFKGNEKTYSYKTHMHTQLKSDKDEYVNHITMKAAISLIGDLRKYEEDGVYFEEKNKILMIQEQNQKKSRPPPEEYVHKSQTPYKQRKIDESLIMLSQDEKNVLENNLQLKKQNSNQDYKEDDNDEGGDGSGDNNEDIKKQKMSASANKPQSKCNLFNKKSLFLNIFKEQKIKHPCYCQEVKEDEMRLCYNKKCSKQWFHIECLKEKIIQINKQANLDEIQQTLPKTDDEWYCDECSQDMASTQKRCVKNRKYLQKKKNIAHYTNIGREDLVQQKIRKRSSKKGSTSSLTMLNNTIFGSENSISLFKSENSNKFNDVLQSSNTLKKAIENVQALLPSGQKSGDKKPSPVMSENSKKPKSPENKNKESTDTKLEGILNKYLFDNIDQSKQDFPQERQPSKSPKQSQSSSHQNARDSPSQSVVNKNIPMEVENIGSNQELNEQLKLGEQQEKLNNSASIVQYPFSSVSNKKGSEEKNKLDLQKDKDSGSIRKLNMEEALDENVPAAEIKKEVFKPITYHKGMLFYCQIEKTENASNPNQTETKKTTRSKRQPKSEQNNIIALISNNPFKIELYNFDIQKKNTNKVYTKSITPESEYYFLQHVVYKNNSYIIFSHETTMTIFSVKEKQIWKINQQIEKDQPFYLSSNETYIQIYTKGAQPNELKCINIQPYEKTISIKEESYSLDDGCRNFQQLCFYKDQNNQMSYMFLSEDRMTIYVYPDLDPNSLKPVISIESEFPLLQMHIIDPEDQKQVLMDIKNQILLYQNNGYSMCENTCVYSYVNKYQLIRYYVEPKNNLLLQLYNEQIHLQYLDEKASKPPQVISRSRPFIDALYKEYDSFITVFFIEKDLKNDQLYFDYFMVDK